MLRTIVTWNINNLKLRRERSKLTHVGVGGFHQFSQRVRVRYNNTTAARQLHTINHTQMSNYKNSINIWWLDEGAISSLSHFLCYEENVFGSFFKGAKGDQTAQVMHWN